MQNKDKYIVQSTTGLVQSTASTATVAYASQTARNTLLAASLAIQHYQTWGTQHSLQTTILRGQPAYNTNGQLAAVISKLQQ